MQAVRSGAVTRAPVLEPTHLDLPCPYCGSDIEVSFSDGWVLVRCLHCPGTYSGSRSDVRAIDTHPYGTIATYGLPPAGLDDRKPEGILQSALDRMHHELLVMAHGSCPRCSAPVARTLRVCADHVDPPDVCARCKRRHALHVDHHCTNCTRVDENIPLGLHLVRVPAIMAFIGAHGVDPVFPDWADLSVHYGYDEALRATDPFEARITYYVDDEALTVTVDDDLHVTEATQHPYTPPA